MKRTLWQRNENPSPLFLSKGTKTVRQRPQPSMHGVATRSSDTSLALMSAKWLAVLRALWSVPELFSDDLRRTKTPGDRVVGRGGSGVVAKSRWTAE